MKVIINNGALFYVKENVIYKDSDFIITKAMFSDTIKIIPLNETYNIKDELPEYIKDKMLQEVI